MGNGGKSLDPANVKFRLQACETVYKALFKCKSKLANYNVDLKK